MESAAIQPPTPASSSETGTKDAESELRQLWSISLQVQGLADSRSDIFADSEGRQFGSQLIRKCCGLLEAEDLKLAQFLLFNCANLKIKKQEQKLFPPQIINRCFFKTRTPSLLRPNQSHAQEAAAYSSSDSESKDSGIRNFIKDFATHLRSLEDKVLEEPSKEEGIAIRDLSGFCLNHCCGEFKEEVRKVAKESKPFEVGARSVSRAIILHRELSGRKDGIDSILQAYCGSVLHRLEVLERMGPAKSARIFDKYLSSMEANGSAITLEAVLGDLDPKTFPQLHHLPMDEFVTLAKEEGSDAKEDSKGMAYQDLFVRISEELNIGWREPARLDTLSQLHTTQVFQVKEDEEDMEPVSARAATRQMMASYRQVRSQLEEVKIKVAHGRHAFGWYSIPRVMEAFLIGGFETLDITGVLPPGAASDPRDPSLSDLRMEYFLAKVESWYQEPPIIASHSSAYVYLFWEIAALGVDPGSIRIESSDEKAGTMALSFDLPGGGGEPRTRTIRYSMADIEGTRKAGLAFPNETDPIVFEAEGDALPSALLFIGESVIKQLPDYQRMSFGNRISLYILENRMQKERVAAPKSRKAEKKKEPPPPPQPEKKEPVLETPLQIAKALIGQERSMGILKQNSLEWSLEAIEKIATGKKVTGKLRRNFKRLHNQLRHREERGYSNRLEGQFMGLLSKLSRQFDSEEEG